MNAYTNTNLQNNCVDTINALQGQKDTLIALLEKANDGQELKKIKELLNFAKELWSSLGHDSKIREIKQRFILRANTLKQTEEEYLAKCRKNDKTRSSTQANIDLLIALIVNIEVENA